MATPKQVMDFRPSKGITTAQSNEHQRRWTEKGWGSAEATGNYDRSRERLNFEIRGGKVYPIDKSRSIPERMADILRSRGIKDPNEGLAEPRFRTVVNFIFGGSRERMTELAFGDQKVDLTHGADNSHLTRCKDIEEWARMFTALLRTNTVRRTSSLSSYTWTKPIRTSTAPSCQSRTASLRTSRYLPERTSTSFLPG